MPKRFPRIDGIKPSDITELLENYPMPPYDAIRDGSFNPGEWVLGSLLLESKSKLREFCERHAMSSEGHRIELIKRMYKHWRAKKMEIGEIYIGYAPGYEFVTLPTCSCGSRRRDSIPEKKKAKKPDLAKPEIKRFPRLFIKRFPRLK